jgi:hypothetical protein
MSTFKFSEGLLRRVPLKESKPGKGHTYWEHWTRLSESNKRGKQKINLK